MNETNEEVATIARLTEDLVGGGISRRDFLRATMAMSATALLAACGGTIQQSPEETVSTGATATSDTIPLYTVENNAATLAFFNMAIATFTEQHPEMNVEVTVYSDATQLQHLTTAFQNQVDVGIFSPPVSHFAPWAQDGLLAPLDALVADIGPDDFMPGTRILVDGTDYGMPLQSNSHLVYYRKDLLEEEGLPVPSTFEEYLGAMEATHGKNNRIGIALAVGATPQLPLFSFAPFIYQSGWDYFDVDGNLTFGEPEVYEAVERFIECMQFSAPSLYNATYGDIVNVYVAGQATFMPFSGRLGVTLWEKNRSLLETTGVVPIPAGPFMTRQLHFGSGQQYALYGETGNPEMAQEFLKHLTTGDEALAFALTVPGHLLPPLRSVRERLLEEVRVSNDPYISQYGDQIVTFAENVEGAMTSSVSMGAVNDHEFVGDFTNICPWAGDIWKSPPIDGVMFQDILLDNVPPEKAFEDAVADMSAATEAWKSENPDWNPEPV